MDRGDLPSLDIGLRMAASLWRFWQQTGALREARQWLEDLLARGTDPSIGSARAKALIAAGGIAYWQTDLGRARDLYEEAVELYRGLGDRRGMADALNNLAPIPMMTGDLPLARQLAGQARDLWQELGDQWQAALAALTLGMSSLVRPRRPATTSGCPASQPRRRRPHRARSTIRRHLARQWSLRLQDPTAPT